MNAHIGRAVQTGCQAPAFTVGVVGAVAVPNRRSYHCTHHLPRHRMVVDQSTSHTNLVVDTPMPNAANIGKRMTALMRDLPEVVAVGVQVDGSAFRVLTVIREFDLDVCEKVFDRERCLYDTFPRIEADFNITGADEFAAKEVLSGGNMDFVWTAR